MHSKVLALLGRPSSSSCLNFHTIDLESAGILEYYKTIRREKASILSTDLDDKMNTYSYLGNVQESSAVRTFGPGDNL